MNTIVKLVFIIAATTASAIPRSRLGLIHRQKRSSEHIIRDCMLVTSEPGHYFFKSVGDDPTVCGVYLMTDPDKIIELQFDYVDLPCNSGGLIAFVDGWELNGGYFPSPGDHRLSLEDRVTEFCGLSRPTRVFVSSQNAALVQYRVPKRSRGFSFRVNFLKNPTQLNSNGKHTDSQDTESEASSLFEASDDEPALPTENQKTLLGTTGNPKIVLQTDFQAENEACKKTGCNEGAKNINTENYETEETKHLMDDELKRLLLIEQLSVARLTKEYYAQLLGKEKREVKSSSIPTSSYRADPWSSIIERFSRKLEFSDKM